MLKKEDGLLDFTQSAIELERRVRAMNPWPGAWFEWNGSPLKVGRASVVSGEKSLASGSRFTVEGRPAVMSADGALVLEEVQPAGKKIMPGKSFLAGAASADDRGRRSRVCGAGRRRAGADAAGEDVLVAAVWDGAG